MMRDRGATSPVQLARLRRRVVPALEPLEARCLFSTGPIATPALTTSGLTPGYAGGYSPSQVLSAYGFDTAASQLGPVSGDGTGQTIAIVEAYKDPTLTTDLSKFDKQFNLSGPPSLQQINETGGASLPNANTVWSTETAMDVEWAHAVAPNANLIVVEANNDQINHLLTAVNTAKNIAAVSVVSMSWGTSEFPTETAYDNIFTTPAGHQSITFVASSGDVAIANGVQWPAVSPEVVSVGGSTLTVTDSGQASEVGFAGAISGVSKFEPTPKFQSGHSPGARTTPDVVYDANPTPGFAVYDASTGGWQTGGGTSGGAPQWAALVAIANQARANIGNASLNGATQTLPTLYQYYQNNQQATITLAATTASAAEQVGALISQSGTPQTNALILALATNTGAAFSTTANTTTSASVPSLAKLAHRVAHPAVLITAPKPVIVRFGNAANSGSAPTPDDVPRIVADHSFTMAIAPGFGSSPIGDNSLLAQALPDLSDIDVSQAAASIAKLAQALYGDVAMLAQTPVVSVGIQSLKTIAAQQNWYLIHINVAATFGDAIASFIDESVTPGDCAVAAGPHRSHARAWVVTAVVFAMDVAVIYYLASYRGRHGTIG